MSEYQPTPKQEQALREYLHEAVVPLIEDVLVKKLGQAMAYLKEQQQPEQEPVGTYEGVMETMLSLRKGTLEPTFDCTDEQLIEEVRRRGFIIRDAQVGAKWVGLTVNEARMFYEKYTNREELIYAIDEFLKEKNT